MYYNIYNPYSSELYHHGILGQRWGIRRYQNEDGTLTDEGKKRYGTNTKERAENYDAKQRARDRRVYSKGAEKRINAKMLNGESIQGARSYEADRLAKYRRNWRTGKKVANVVGTAAGIAAGYLFINKFINGPAGYNFIQKVNNPTMREGIQTVAYILNRNKYYTILGASVLGATAATTVADRAIPAIGGYKKERMYTDY